MSGYHFLAVVFFFCHHHDHYHPIRVPSTKLSSLDQVPVLRYAAVSPGPVMAGPAPPMRVRKQHRGAQAAPQEPREGSNGTVSTSLLEPDVYCGLERSLVTLDLEHTLFTVERRDVVALKYYYSLLWLYSYSYRL